MYLDLGRWITGSALCLSGPLKRLAYSRIDLLWQSAVASVYISREHGRLKTTRNFVWDLCLYHSLFNNLQLHVHYNWNTPRSSEEPQRLQTTSSGYPRTKGQESWCLSVWNLCLCHYKSTQLHVHLIVLFVRGTCASWSSSYIQYWNTPRSIFLSYIWR